MKRIPSFLIALTLGVTTSAQAGLITDPLSFDQPIIDQGLTTDPLGQGGPLPGPKPPVNVSAAAQFLADVTAEGQIVRLADLFLNPEFFAAAHAVGPEADALRGQIDWLMLTGVILGFDGMDGSDDLRGGDSPDEISSDSSNGIILGGPGGDTLFPQQNIAPLTPFNPSIILGGPGGDTLLPQVNTAPLTPFNPSIILGGPGGDTIILGGPGGDTFSSDSAEHNPN